MVTIKYKCQETQQKMLNFAHYLTIIHAVSLHKHSFLNLCNWVRKRNIHSLLIASSVGHLNLPTCIHMNNCIYPNLSWSKVPDFDNLKAYEKRKKPLLYNGDSKFECTTEKTEARSGTLETGILKHLYLFSEKKVYLYDLLQLSQRELLLNECKKHGACMSLHSCVSC